MDRQSSRRDEVTCFSGDDRFWTTSPAVINCAELNAKSRGIVLNCPVSTNRWDAAARSRDDCNTTAFVAAATSCHEKAAGFGLIFELLLI